MIYDFLTERLNRVPELRGVLYPVAAQVGGVAVPFGLYTIQQAEAERDLSGGLLAYTQTVQIDLLHEDYDELQRIGAAAEKELACQQLQAGECWIFDSSVSGLDGDNFDLETELFRYGITVTVRYWR